MDFDFATAETVDDLATVPENFRGAYEEKDGKYVLSDAARPLATAIAGLSKALKGERTLTGELRKKPDATSVLRDVFGEDLDLDTAKDKIQGYVATIAERTKVDPAKIRGEIEATFSTERKGFETRLAGMQNTLSSYLVQKEAATAIAGAKGNATLLMPHVAGRAKVVEENGEYVVRVLDADGQYRGDGQGGFMGVAELVAEMKTKPEFGGAFESDKSGGSQQQQRNTPPGPAAQQRQQQRDGQANKSSSDKIASGLARLTGGH
jgi:hypothetical protein